MSSYSPERKAALIRKLLPPQNMSVAELSRQEGISQATLYAWRTKLKAGGAVVPGDKNNADDWPAEAKFAAVLHASTLSEIELSEYCRSKGLYPEQISAWRQACITGQLSAKAQLKAERDQARADKKRITELERELRRKDKALAETAAIWCCEKR
jgi:transposase-like protein